MDIDLPLDVGLDCDIYDDNGNQILLTYEINGQQRANAEFMTRACNNHDALVLLATEAIQLQERFSELYRQERRHEEADKVDELIVLWQETLAKAKGE